eukprot:6111904-Pleurochrysis_carterae.AAC.2
MQHDCSANVCCPCFPELSGANDANLCTRRARADTGLSGGDGHVACVRRDGAGALAAPLGERRCFRQAPPATATAGTR